MTDGTLFIHYLTISRTIGYLLIFFGMIIEGDAVLFTAAFLTHQQNFDLRSMLLVVLSGTLIGDILWYYFGLKLNHSQRFAFIHFWIDKIVKPFDSQLYKRPFKTILISKFLYGLHHAILMRVGSLNLSMRKFLRIDAVSIVVWVMLVGGLGYLSGVSFSFFKRSLKFAEIILGTGFLFFLLLIHFIRPWLVKDLANNSNEKI